jgi:hypothetical protein
MARKPVHLEMSGGKTPRQRTWEAIRKCRDHFSPDDIIRLGHVSENIVREYLQSLLAGGYIEVASTEKINRLCTKRTYRLVRDNGLEAPRLTKSGQEVTQGNGNDAMWGTLRRMFKAESVDYRQLAAFASTQRTPISLGTAKTYVLTLAAAGYLECVQPAVKGGKALPGRFRLIPAMDSGHRSPMIQRTKSVFDPNLNKVVWTEEKGIEDEQ